MKKITRRKLISSGILNDFTDYLKHQIKNKKARSYCLNLYLNNIIHNFNFLRKINSFQDPAKDYLKELQRDYTLLCRLVTHKPNIEPLKRIIGYEIQVAKKYCAQFRNQKFRDYAKNFVFLILFDLLSDYLRYEKRIQTISELWQFYLNSDEPVDKRISHLDCPNIKRRLRRIKYYFTSHFESKRYKEYEKFRICDLTESFKKLKTKDKKVNQLLKSKAKFKKYIKQRYIVQRLDELVEKQRNQYHGFNILKLPRILRSLGVKKTELLSIHNSIISDSEFMLVFKASI